VETAIPSIQVLLISREPAAALNGLLSTCRNSWHLDQACSGLEALEHVQSDVSLDLVLLDLVQGDSDALHTLRWLRKVRPELPIVLLSSTEDSQELIEGLHLGARDHVLKPVQEQELEIIVKRHINPRPPKNGSGAMIEDIEEIGQDLFFVAASPSMRKLRTQAELLAKVNVPVLILGESGSGKEVVARLIHKLSVRSGCRFLKVNCAALPGDLLESELFGYERGAFTGAMRTRQGKFELCEKGTILLDEIAEMPTSLQAKLLHVLQDKQFFRLGGEKTIDVDVRILAATNVNVEQALAKRRLREDLYYRLSAFTIQVPSLRERKEEISLLLGHFMNRMARHYGLPARAFSTRLLGACHRYSWPGNLRELENFVKRYLVMGDESVALSELEPRSDGGNGEAIPGHSAENLNDAIEAASHITDDPAGLKTMVRSVKGEAERSAIVNTLTKTHWNRKEAARVLRISYRGLLYKIQEYQLRPPATYFAAVVKDGGDEGNGQGH
jgi:DNA-binding NtrC family response regulator